MNGFDRATLLYGLQRLGLIHMQQMVEHRAEEAAASSGGYLEFLHRIVEAELSVGFERHVETRTRLANFLSEKPWSNSTLKPSGVDKRAIMELASMSFVDRATNVVLLGPPGVSRQDPSGRRPRHGSHPAWL